MTRAGSRAVRMVVVAVTLAMTSLAAALGAVPASPVLAAPAADLPPGFTIEPSLLGPELVWSGAEVTMGGARPEFRLAGEVLGHPREVDGELRLLLSVADQERLAGAGADLEVWSSGRRLDGAGPVPDRGRCRPTTRRRRSPRRWPSIPPPPGGSAPSG